MKKRRKLKTFVLPSLYAVLILGLITLTFFVSESMRPLELVEDPSFHEPVIEPNLPVIAEPIRIIKPFTDENVTIAKHFYDYRAESENQENSITFFNNTYMQNSGICFVLESDDPFDIVSVLDGTVTNVKEDDVLGKIIEIKHDHDLVTIYQGLSEITVGKGDKVVQGQIIGKSGTNQLAQDLGNHLHFEIYHKGRVVNPEDFFGKEISKLN